MEILNQFGVQPILLAAQVVNFLILLILLKKFLYKPLLKVLEERKKRIEEGLKNASEIERKLLKAQDQSEKIITKALLESQKILDQTNAEAAQILEDARKEAVEIINIAHNQALEQLKSERVNLQQEVKENLASLAALIFEKVTGRTMSGKDQMAIIEKEVKNLS